MRSAFTTTKTLEARVNERFNTAAAVADVDKKAAATATDNESKIAYLRGSVGVQITKASALRTYDGLLVTVSGLLVQRSDLLATVPLVLLGCVILFAVTAALLTLGTSWTNWAQEAEFKTSAGEVGWLLRVLTARGNIVNIAVILSILATVALALVLIITLVVGPNLGAVPPIKTGQ